MSNCFSSTFLHTIVDKLGRQWTASVESGSEAIASALRIESFLLEPEEEKEEPTTLSPTVSTTTATAMPLVSISESSYFYGNNDDAKEMGHKTSAQQRPTTTTLEHPPILRGIHLSVCPGELLMITGPVGSGKSSLLNVLLGEMKQCEHTGVHIGNQQRSNESTRGIARVIKKGLRTAYCAQRPWILASSVLSNVTLAGKARTTTNSRLNPSSVDDFKRPLVEDEELYQLAVETTRVVVDMLSWPNYDDTEGIPLCFFPHSFPPFTPPSPNLYIYLSLINLFLVSIYKSTHLCSGGEGGECEWRTESSDRSGTRCVFRCRQVALGLAIPVIQLSCL